MKHLAFYFLSAVIISAEVLYIRWMMGPQFVEFLTVVAALSFGLLPMVLLSVAVAVKK